VLRRGFQNWAAKWADYLPNKNLTAIDKALNESWTEALSDKRGTAERLAGASGQELRRESAEAFGSLFTKAADVTEARTSVTANDDPRRVTESSDATSTLAGLSLLELRRAVGKSIPDRPPPGPLTASSVRADVEFLAGYWIRTKAAEKEALAQFANQ